MANSLAFDNLKINDLNNNEINNNDIKTINNIPPPIYETDPYLTKFKPEFLRRKKSKTDLYTSALIYL